jgi:hypothetical protein
MVVPVMHGITANKAQLAIFDSRRFDDSGSNTGVTNAERVERR